MTVERISLESQPVSEPGHKLPQINASVEEIELDVQASEDPAHKLPQISQEG